MKRMLLLMPMAGLLAVVGTRAWAEEPKPVDQKQADRYTLPEGGVDELLKFIGELSQVRPDTPKEDIEHRSKFRPALRQAAEKILELEKDQTSMACRVAKFILLTNRVHAIAQGGPEQRKKTVADVKAYLAEQVRQGQAQRAANLAKLAATTLQQTGEYELAAEGPTSVLPKSSPTAKMRRCRAWQARWRPPPGGSWK